MPLDGHMLRLTPDLFADEALCFLISPAANCSTTMARGRGSSSRWKIFRTPRSGHGRRRNSWQSRPGPATGDPENFEGDLFDKPSMIILEPGEQGRHSARYEFLPDSSQAQADLQALSHLPKGR